MIQQLWQRLALWFGFRYNIWPWWWYDARDVTWISVGNNFEIIASEWYDDNGITENHDET